MTSYDYFGSFTDLVPDTETIQDISITSKVKKAAEVMDIKLLDHLILTEESYFSFADEGIL